MQENKIIKNRPFQGKQHQMVRDSILYSIGNNETNKIRRPYPTEGVAGDDKISNLLKTAQDLMPTEVKYWDTYQIYRTSPFEHQEIQVTSNPMFFPKNPNELILTLFLKRQRIPYKERGTENPLQSKYRALSYQIKDYYEQYANAPLTCPLYTEAIPLIYVFGFDEILKPLQLAFYNASDFFNDDNFKKIHDAYKNFILQTEENVKDPVKHFTQNFSILGCCLTESTPSIFFATVLCTFYGNPNNGLHEYCVAAPPQTNEKGVSVYRQCFVDLDEIENPRLNAEQSCLPYTLYLFVGLNPNNYLSDHTLVIRIIKSRHVNKKQVLEHCIKRLISPKYTQDFVEHYLFDGVRPSLGAIQQIGRTSFIPNNEQQYIFDEAHIIFPKLFINITEDWLIR